MNRYVCEYENGLKITVYSKKSLQDVRILNPEGLRSITQR